MKKFKKLCMVVLLFTLMIPTHVYANDEIEYKMLEELNETDKVLELPNGGYLYGTGVATVYDYEEYVDGQRNPIEIYDLSEEENMITVEEAKENLENKDSLETRGTSVPTQIMTLGAGVVYVSNTFSGSGWRFSGYQFLAEASTGYYLKWTTYVDDGRVGNTSQAITTLRGYGIQGIALYANASQWLNFGPNGQVYYTYNPINGTYYRVENN
jgi:hypothetical protein